VNVRSDFGVSVHELKVRPGPSRPESHDVRRSAIVVTLLRRQGGILSIERTGQGKNSGLLKYEANKLLSRLRSSTLLNVGN